MDVVRCRIRAGSGSYSPSSPQPRRPCAMPRSASSPACSAPWARPTSASCSGVRSRSCSSSAFSSSGSTLPRPELIFWPWVLLGALMQIAATALMLAAMAERSFVVAIAYIKTEPIQVALFGLVFLGDRVTPGMAAAILIATAGVIVMSAKSGAAKSGAAVGGPRCSGFPPAPVRVLRDRLSRRDPEPCRSRLSDDGDLHHDRRADRAVGAADGLSLAARSAPCSPRS